MRVIVDSDHPCHSSERIARALERYSPPWATPIRNSLGGYHAGGLTRAERSADVVLIHAGGRWRQTLHRTRRYDEAGIRYAILQLALRGTGHPHVSEWLPFWRRSAVVWSYYDLRRWAREEGEDVSNVNCYHSPLGVDEVFHFPLETTPRAVPLGLRRRLFHGVYGGPLVIAEGNNLQRDSLRQIAKAVGLAGGRLIHLGPPILDSPKVTSITGLDDLRLAALYGVADWVAALRTVEGFELCAAEGLSCGARPILYDREGNRHWYGGLARYIPEGRTTTEALTSLLSGDGDPVTRQEVTEARERFNWETIAHGFWEALAKGMEGRNVGTPQQPPTPTAPPPPSPPS